MLLRWEQQLQPPACPKALGLRGGRGKKKVCGQGRGAAACVQLSATSSVGRAWSEAAVKCPTCKGQQDLAAAGAAAGRGCCRAAQPHARRRQRPACWHRGCSATPLKMETCFTFLFLSTKLKGLKKSQLWSSRLQPSLLAGAVPEAATSPQHER